MGIIRTILLTGASGYLGRNLVKGFVGAGHKLILLVRANSNVRFAEKYEANITIYRLGEVALRDIFCTNQIDVIVHTATSYGRKSETMAEVLDANLGFPIQILSEAIKHQVKYFVNTDTSLPKSLNWYSLSKKQLLEWLHASSSAIRILNLQLEYFYGPNDDPSKFVTFLLNEFRSGKESIDFTEATQLRDFIYIDDVVQAYVLLIDKLETLPEMSTVQIGSGRAISLKEIIIKVQHLLNAENVKLNFGSIPMRKNEIMYSCADTLFLEKIGWRAMVPFEEGILKMIKNEQ